MAAAQIFFLRGMQKSGTKWMGNLLNLHPRILCRGEYHFGVLDDAIKRWHQINGLTRSLGEAATQNLTAFIERSVTSNPSKPDIVWFGDRTPGEIDRGVLPDAPRIFLLRDGRDILVSRTYHYLRLGLQLPHCSPDVPQIFKAFPALGEKLALFSKDPAYFDKHTRDLLDDEHWVRMQARRWQAFINAHDAILDATADELRDQRIAKVSYEDIHRAPDPERTRLYEFLGLDATDALPLDAKTRPGKSERDNLAAFRSGRVGDWREYFSESVSRWFQEEAGEALRKSGYE